MPEYDEARAELSARNRAFIDRFYDGIISGDRLDPDAVLAPDVVVYEPAVFPYAGSYRGAEGRARLATEQSGVLDASTLTILDLYAHGERVISRLTVGVAESPAQIMLSEHIRITDGWISEMRVFVFDEVEQPCRRLFPDVGASRLA